MQDYLALLRDADEQKQQEREQREVTAAARTADIKEFNDAWHAVFSVCQTGDSNPNLTPDLSPFIALAKQLKRRGWDIWLEEMAAGFARNLDDRLAYRPGHLFVVQLLMSAGKQRATKKQLAADYESFVPSRPPMNWRTTSAGDICEYIKVRVDQAAIARNSQESERAAKAVEERLDRLRESARRRPSLEKQLFAVHWRDQNLGPAKIRLKWNAAHPEEPFEPGRAGRHHVTMTIRRGREFLNAQGTTVAELAGLLNIALGQ